MSKLNKAETMLMRTLILSMGFLAVQLAPVSAAVLTSLNCADFSDADTDGVPNCVDVVDSAPVQQLRSGDAQEDGLGSLFGVTDTGYDLVLSPASARAGARGILVAAEALDVPDDGYLYTSGIFSFDINGYPEYLEAAYRVSLPLTAPIPEGAVYRKFDEVSGTWYDFVEDAGNSVSSAPGEPGICPAPGAAEWEPGLNAGYWCVQLQIEDGGLNDSDGVQNFAISDPGGVAVVATGNAAPIANDDEFEVSNRMSFALDVQANDSDADNDLLAFTSVTPVFGSVEVMGDVLSYTAPFDYIGQDALVYAISDGQGGTDVATVFLDVVGNLAPEAVDDEFSVYSGEATVIDVLANDLDNDGDDLIITAAEADVGMVSINDDETLTYTAPDDYEGLAFIAYEIIDTSGLLGSAEVDVSVSAAPPPAVEPPPPPKIRNSSGGGALGWVTLVLMLLAVHRRFRVRDRLPGA